MMKPIILFFAVIIAGCDSSLTNPSREIQNFFDLNTRLKNADLHHFSDGGTYALVLKDANDHVVEMCVSSARFTQVVAREEANQPETLELLKGLKQVRVYIGATHPYYEDAEEVEYRGELESEIIDRLREFIARNPQFKDDISRFISASQVERRFDVIYE